LPPGVTDPLLDPSFLVRAGEAWCTEVRLEQVVAAKPDKGFDFVTRTPALPGWFNFNSSAEIVVTDPARNSAKMREGQQVRIQKALLSL
jgi:hypothetical protein